MKMYCYDCDKDVETILKKEVRTGDFRGKTFKYKIDVHYCSNCGNELINDVLDEQLKRFYNAYLNCFNLSISSFKYIRSSLGLTQDLFAKVLGWGKRSIIRYENNDEMPQTEYLNTYINLSLNPDNILDYLKINKSDISKEDYKKILSRLQLNISVKARNVILYILKDNALFMLQLIKNMFAVDFLNYKNNGESITDFDYIKMEYGPVIDGYKDIINNMVKSGEIKISDIEVINGIERTKYIAVSECYLEIFSEEELKTLKEVKKKLKNQSGTSLSEWPHEFIGWIKTPLNKKIDYKYAKDFMW